MNDGIRNPEITRDNNGQIVGVRVGFGPHYIVDLNRTDSGQIMLVLGATHHGFRADASKVGGQLEMLVDEIRRNHPETAID